MECELKRLASLLLLLIAGCSSGAQVQLTLSSDPRISDPAQVAQQVAELWIVVDAPQGLHGVATVGPQPGGGEALDWDGDGQLEIVFKTPHTPGTSFATLEVGVDGQRDLPLTFRVLGFASATSSEPVAYGEASVTVGRDEVKSAIVNFNLRASARPPQVTLVLPPDGTGPVPPTTRAVTLVFSTTIDPSTLGAVHLAGPGGEATVTRVLDVVALASATRLEEPRSILTLTPTSFAPAAVGARYTVTVGTDLKSAAGLGFDQDPSTSAADSFGSSFVALWDLDAAP